MFVSSHSTFLLQIFYYVYEIKSWFILSIWILGDDYRYILGKTEGLHGDNCLHIRAFLTNCMFFYVHTITKYTQNILTLLWCI